MKKTMVSVAMMLAVASGAVAGDGTVTIPIEDYKAILKQLDSLQQRVDTLEGRQSSPTASDAKYDKLTKDIDDIYDTMDVIETKQIKNKLNFGGELRVKYDSYTIKNFNTVNMTTFQQGMMSGLSPQMAMSQAMEHHDKVTDNNNWTNRFRINMEAEITEGLAFHGRLTMYKNWSDSDDGSASDMLNDFNRAHRPNSSALWVDRAYVDWIPQGLPFPLAITVGRHPSTEGPPYEFKENRMRQSTYPALIFDGEQDGIVTTFGLERYTGLKNSGLRFGYGKAYHSDDDNNIGSPVPFFDDGEKADSTIFATFLESEIPGLSNSLMVFSYAKMWELPFYFSGPKLYETGMPNTDLGDMDLWGVHVQAQDIAGSGVDFFFSYGGNKSNPNGNSAFGLYGLLSGDGQSSETGYSIYTGLRYSIPFEPMNQPKIGFEYNHGSQYWFSMTAASPDLYNKLATRGNVYDFYYLQPVNKHLFFRAGYTRVEYDYTGSANYMGTPYKSDATLDNYYLLMDVHF